VSILLIVFCALLAIQMYEKSGSFIPPPPPPQVGIPKSGIAPRSVFGSVFVSDSETDTDTADGSCVVLVPRLSLTLPAVAPLSVALPSVGVGSVGVESLTVTRLTCVGLLPVPVAVSSRPPLSPQPTATDAKIKVLSSLRIVLPPTRGSPQFARDPTFKSTGDHLNQTSHVG
jgi:hypothetical protein